MTFEDFLRWNNIILKIVDLPYHMKGFAYYDGNEYLVLLNARCSLFQQKETLVHELIHIFQNHLSCYKGYEEICEKEVDSIINKLRCN